LPQASLETIRQDLFAEGANRRIIWVIAKELDDPGDEIQAWRGSVKLPVAHRLLSDAELVSYLPLKKAQIQPSLSEMVAQRIQLIRIGRQTWFQTS